MAGRKPKKIPRPRRNPKDRMTPMEVAVWLGLSLGTIYLFMREGLPAVRTNIGSTIDPKDTLKFLEKTGRLL